MTIAVPKLSLILLIGPAGTGKSTFASQHFKDTEIVSSDRCRALISDDPENQAVSRQAFDVLYHIVHKRLRFGRLTVVDATNVQVDGRAHLLDIAAQYYTPAVAIALNLPEHVALERNRHREDRHVDEDVIAQQYADMNNTLNRLHKEPFFETFVLDSVDDIETVDIERYPLPPDRTEESGPFDIVGDLHGCADELEALLDRLGYVVVGENTEAPLGGPVYAHPDERKAIFVGDIFDRGPRILDSYRIVYNMVSAGKAMCLPGNHDVRIVRKLKGQDVRVTFGLGESLAELEQLPEAVREPLRDQIIDFFAGMADHFVLDGGRLVVAHAGLKEEMHGRMAREVRRFCLYGETTGETDEYGLPVRHKWAEDYTGSALVVYGHTARLEPEWLNNTVNIDTGCVYGGSLTALRYPERDLVSVPARRVYSPSLKPLPSNGN